MNMLKNLLIYHYKIYIKSNKFIIPFLVWLIWIYSIYSTTHVSVVSNFLLSMGCLFYLMVWIGLTYMEIEDSISEQLLILKARSENIYYVSKILFLVFIGMTMSLIGVIFPIIKNIIGKSQLYSTDITISDLGIALIFHSFVSILGVTTGTLLHPRIMKERKMAIMLTVAIALMSIIKIPMNIEIPFTRFLTWIFPPLFNTFEWFTGKEHFIIKDVGVAILYISVYSGIFIFFQLNFLKRNKF
ncbi:hypothetical protein SH2C18_14990 [Clostridium sediminicola]|uniref:hypothetical protein n=1 Tax=Clostridium sediminicola TaxID=3114879 RepID=UPI0031F2558F